MPYSYEEARGVLRVTLKGKVTAPELHDFLDELETLVLERQEWPDNLLDLREVDLSGLGFMDMLGFSKRRKGATPPNPIRTALVAVSPTIIGFARMFQNMNKSAQITVEVFPTLEAANAWLAKKPG